MDIETDLPTEPGALLGYRKDGRPIFLAAGGAEDDDPEPDPEADPEPDDDPEDDPEPEPEDDKPGPAGRRKPAAKNDEGDTQTAADLARARAALKKANAEARKHREELKKLRQQHESEDEAKAREAKESGAKEAAAKLKPVAIRASARAAFLAAGAAGDDANVKRLVRLLSMDDIDVDDEGDVTGLDDQVDEIKEQYPELFRASKADDGQDGGRERKRRPGPADGAGKKPADEKLTSAQQLARMLG